MNIEKASSGDLDELDEFYGAVNDYLSAGENYAGWKRGMYPTRETAEQGVSDGSLYVLRIDGVIAGSVILDQKAPEAYDDAQWSVQAEKSELVFVHTLAVHPDYLRRGIAEELMAFAKEYAEQRRYKAIRLDTPAQNAPAIALYEKCGYKYLGDIDLGLNIPWLPWFRLYELVLREDNAASGA